MEETKDSVLNTEGDERSEVDFTGGRAAESAEIPDASVPAEDGLAYDAGMPEEPEPARDAGMPEESEPAHDTGGSGLPQPEDIRRTIIADRGSAEGYAAEGAVSEAESEKGLASEAAADDPVSEEEGPGSGRLGLPEGHPEMGELGERIRQRRLEKDRRKRRFRTRFYVITVGFFLLTAGLIFSVSGFFTVDSIEVRGNSHYSAEEIINMGHAVPGRNLIYHPGKADIIGYLEQNPYIKRADVGRKLPSTLVITVIERKERLAFRYDDDYLIMDEEGILLRKTRNEPMTTLVDGIVVNRIKLGEKIGTEDKARTSKALKLVKLAADSDMYFVRVDMSDDKVLKAYIYETLIVKTDYDTLITNLKNGRLHMVVEKLFGEGIKRGTISFDKDGSASFMPIF